MGASGNSHAVIAADDRVAVCGDWRGDTSWLSRVATAIDVLTPDAKTILQLGDWWMAPVRTDAFLANTRISRVYVTLGNHEPWGQLAPLLADDPAWRDEGRDWWPDVAISDAQVLDATSAGRADVMLTHEVPASTPVDTLRTALQASRYLWPQHDLDESAPSRARVDHVWNSKRPHFLLHGHMHAPCLGQHAGGRRVVSLGVIGRRRAW
ncbi:hypothetical protein R2Q81_10450 [Microbacterium aquimaris]|uniref:metallophosphoesterase n=1 Tax=Microbacterium aquimaris TaxID=459816 RepID=UPI002AD2739C|nr:metallophosphoesterase [Microbacterium aquimaris]MDZ8276365.1 hypothetical protein [Microbacterium aquimaris]